MLSPTGRCLFKVDSFTKRRLFKKYCAPGRSAAVRGLAEATAKSTAKKNAMKNADEPMNLSFVDVWSLPLASFAGLRGSRHCSASKAKPSFAAIAFDQATRLPASLALCERSATKSFARDSLVVARDLRSFAANATVWSSERVQSPASQRSCERSDQSAIGSRGSSSSWVLFVFKGFL